MDLENAAKNLNDACRIAWQCVHHWIKLRDKLEFSHGVKPYRRLGVASAAQKTFTKSTSPIRERHRCSVRLAASAAGGLIAFYQIGYGIAAFGVGPLQTWAGLDLNIIYGGTAAVALVMAALSFAVTPAQDVNKQ